MVSVLYALCVQYARNNNICIIIIIIIRLFSIHVFFGYRVSADISVPTYRNNDMRHVCNTYLLSTFRPRNKVLFRLKRMIAII